RCHIKVNEPRYYYWADRLGLLVMYDLPSASIYTPKARANWERTFREALARDYSHPCIFAWILFNETWGLEEHQRPEGWNWVKEMYYLAKELDPTRLVEDNSPYLYDHVTTDLNTWHFYIGDYERARRHVDNVVSQSFEGSPYHYVGGVYGDVQGAEAYRQGTQPLLNSEYAGISAWSGDRDIAYSFKFLTGELRRHDIICGYVYTELTDVEWEHNGLLNYDRSPKEFGYDHFVPGMSVADLTGADFVGLDCPPCQTLPPGATFQANVFVGHWDRRKLTDTRLHWRVSMVDRFGEARDTAEGSRPIEVRQYGVTVVGGIETPLPAEPCLVTVAFWLEDEHGQVRVRNYVNVDVYSARSEIGAERTPTSQVLRFLPGDFVGSSWLDPRLGPRGSKFGGAGSGWVDYAVVLPDDLDTAAVRRLRLRFEAGARTAHARVDWKDPRHMHLGDYPQTEARKIPSDVVVWLNGHRLGAVRLPDDPADARGVLSLHTSDYWEPGSYGFLTTLEADTDLTRRILDGALGGRLIVRFDVPRSRAAGGLNLYGSRVGAFPVTPTIFLDF
ncbi:MAG TPA: glycoside hydrolase family 2 TIM barrel-domain containing protein, partial [Chloroflexota bacterium]|nr:glycoside hydrolase family 2 TIM barrel-domain containing protein [Chloroflexota bacterium]